MADILVIDDEPAVASSLGFALEDDHTVRICLSAADALAAVDQRPPEVVLLDMRLGESDGLAVLKEIRQKSPGTVVIMMTAHGSIENAVASMQAGAFHYLSKPVNTAELQLLVSKAAEYARLTQRVSDLTREMAGIYGIEGLVGRAESIQRVRELVARVRNVDSTVLITGESGTGKELVARALHFTGSRQSGPFEVVNCAAIPEHLLESELFGYEQGAFTGATRAQRGRFERANGGTLFLDEVGELPPAVQPKLLRVLQDRVIQPLGGGDSRRVEVRIVAATNRDLRKMADQGKLREDLYFRLNVIPIHLPALRERPEDIPELAVYFLDRIADRIGKRCRLSPDALDHLRRYSFPGNVRELQNLLERAAVLAPGDEVLPADLPTDTKAPPTAARPTGTRGVVQVPVGQTLAQIEKTYTLATLAACGNNRRQAARVLGISERNLRYKLAAYRAEEQEQLRLTGI